MSRIGVSHQEVIRAAVEASGFLAGTSYDPSRALAIIEPYAEQDELTGGSADQIRMSRSIVCAVMADCFGELGDFCTAANWYRRASGYWKKGGFPTCYADLVIKHELVDHFEPALDCLRANRADWMSRPLFVRLYYHIVSRWWMYPSQWAFMFRTRSLTSKLESLIAEWHRR